MAHGRLLRSVTVSGSRRRAPDPYPKPCGAPGADGRFAYPHEM